MSLVKYSIDEIAIRPCQSFDANAGIGDCIFPPGWKGMWNISTWCGLPAPGKMSTGRLSVADPTLGKHIGFRSSAQLFGRVSPIDTEWQIGIEPVTDAIVHVRITSQMNAQMRRTLSEPALFVGEEQSDSNESVIPSFWVRLSQQRSKESAAEIHAAALWLSRLDIAPLLVLPVLVLVLCIALWDVGRKLPELQSYAGSGSKCCQALEAEDEVDSPSESDVDDNESYKTADGSDNSMHSV